MPKKHKVLPIVGYLKCVHCGHVSEVEAPQIGGIMKPSRRLLACGCKEYGARHVSKEEGFDAIVRQQVEGAAA